MKCEPSDAGLSSTYTTSDSFFYIILLYIFCVIFLSMTVRLLCSRNLINWASQSVSDQWSEHSGLDGACWKKGERNPMEGGGGQGTRWWLPPLLPVSRSRLGGLLLKHFRFPVYDPWQHVKSQRMHFLKAFYDGIFPYETTMWKGGFIWAELIRAKWYNIYGHSLRNIVDVTVRVLVTGRPVNTRHANSRVVVMKWCQTVFISILLSFKIELFAKK